MRSRAKLGWTPTDSLYLSFVNRDDTAGMILVTASR